MSLKKNKIVAIALGLILLPLPSIGQETCIIWMAQGAECNQENIETTLRTGNQLQIIAPNHGNVLSSFEIIIYNSNSKSGTITISQGSEIILEERIRSGMNRFEVNTVTGRIRVRVEQGEFNLSTTLLVRESVELPILNANSLYDAIANVEFLIKTKFYGEAYKELEKLKLEYPNSYEVWAALTILHLELGNQALMREAAANAIMLLPQASPEKIRAILVLIS